MDSRGVFQITLANTFQFQIPKDPTVIFVILEPQNSRIGEIYVVPERWIVKPNSKLRKGPSEYVDRHLLTSYDSRDRSGFCGY